MSNNPGSLRSVERAISVLEVLATRGEAGVTEVASEIAVHKSTAFRLLGALEGGGLVEQTGHRGKYRLRFGPIRWRARCPTGSTWCSRAAPCAPASPPSSARR